MRIPRLYVENAEKHEDRKVVIENDGKVIRFLDKDEEYEGDGKFYIKLYMMTLITMY